MEYDVPSDLKLSFTSSNFIAVLLCVFFPSSFPASGGRRAAMYA